MKRDQSGSSFQPSCQISTLKAKANLIGTIRRFFDNKSFVEVFTPTLSQDTVVDLHIDPIEVPIHGASQTTRYLQTSPEFLMKRMVAAGAESIYQIAHAYRAGESGNRHNPEFLMLEWYRTGDTYQQGMELLEEFGKAILEVDSVRRRTFGDAFSHYTQLDYCETPDKQMMAACQREGFTPSQTDNALLNRRQLIDFLWSHLVEPNLGNGGDAQADFAEIIYDWPETDSALAIVRNSDPPVAERYELYYRGVELANGYHELLDAEILRDRNEKVNRQRIVEGKKTLPVESRLLQAMEAGLPGCCGVAVGIDRLLMCLLGTDKIGDVIEFDWNRA